MRASAASGNRFTREKYPYGGKGVMYRPREMFRANETFRVEETYFFFLFFFFLPFFIDAWESSFFVSRSVFVFVKCLRLKCWKCWDYRRKNDEVCEFLKKESYNCNRMNFCYYGEYTHIYIYIYLKTINLFFIMHFSYKYL